MSFNVVGAHVSVDLFYFVYLFVGEGASGWVEETAGHRGVGCLPSVGLLWAPDLHL